MRILAVLTLVSLMPVLALGQDTGMLRLPGPPPLELPAWLAPVAGNLHRADKNTPEEATSSYVTQAPPSEVVAHYEAKLRAAGISFETRPDESGTAIEANSGPYLGTVRIQPADGGAHVDVHYARKPAPRPASQPAATTVAASAPPRAQAPADDGPRRWYEATPRKGEEWKWALQSVKFGAKNPKYTYFYYEKATGRSVETLLSLPEGGEIIHVFPVDCEFFIQDENGRQIRFKKAQEALGRTVGPGNWMVYPVNISGVVVYIR